MGWRRRERRPGEVPKAPVNARVVDDEGNVIPFELVYAGVDAQGMHRWRPVHLPPLDLRRRWTLLVDELPGRTGIHLQAVDGGP